MQFDQQTKDTPDYFCFNIRGSASTSTNPEGYLIFYGVKKWLDFVPPQIYDRALESSMFEYDGGKMKMNMDLDLNGNSINAPFFIPAYYKKSKSKTYLYLCGELKRIVFPFDCVLKTINCYFVWSAERDRRITLNISEGFHPVRSQQVHSNYHDIDEPLQVISAGFTSSKKEY